jgi:hypothetical protein
MTPSRQSVILFGILAGRERLLSSYSSRLIYRDFQMIVIKPSKKIFDRLLFCIHS